MRHPLTLTPNESLTICESSPELVEVEVLAGAIRARIDGEERSYGPGERFEIPRGVAHQMWNPSDEPARAVRRTTPAGRTHEWFVALDELRRSGRVDRKGMPGPLAMGVLLAHYRDVFQLAARPRALVRGALALLGAVGRMRGYCGSPG